MAATIESSIERLQNMSTPWNLAAIVGGGTLLATRGRHPLRGLIASGAGLALVAVGASAIYRKIRGRTGARLVQGQRSTERHRGTQERHGPQERRRTRDRRGGSAVEADTVEVGASLGDLVDRSGADSFPASDAPSWSPTTAGRPHGE
jgi:hypothetical protein